MKKSYLAICILFLFAALWSPLSARAAAQVDVLVTASPDALPSSGSVTLNVSVTVAALTTGEITDASLFMTGGSTPLHTWRSIRAGTSVTEAIPGIYVGESQLGTTIPMELRYFDAGVEKIIYTGVSVFRGVPQTVHESSVRFTREASSDTASTGAPVTLTYWIGNTGSLPIYDIAVQDPAVGAVGTRNVLSPGESITFFSTLTMRETSISTPVLTYRERQGGDTVSVALDPYTVVLAEAKLTVTLDADQKEIRAGEAVRFTYNIVNEGNIAFRNLQISDDTGGMIPGRDELPPGGSYVYTRKENLVKPGEFFFVATAEDATGNPVQLKSNVVSIDVIDVAQESSQPVQEVLSITVTPNITKLTAPGDVTFDITVRNQGGEAVLDMVLSESAAGEIETMEQLSSDKAFVFTATVSEPRTFTFTVRGRLASTERRVQVVSDPIEITVEAAVAESTPFPWEQASPSPDVTAAPTPAPADDSESGSSSLPGNRSVLLLVSLGVVVLLIIICIIALIAMTRRNRRHNEYSPDAYDFYEDPPLDDDPNDPDATYPLYDDDYAPTEPLPLNNTDADVITQPVNRTPPSTNDVPTRPRGR